VAYLQPRDTQKPKGRLETAARQVGPLDSTEPQSLHPPGFPLFHESGGGSQ
jgi:hypothetical protein